MPIADDWTFVYQARHRGFSAFVRGTDVQTRPLQALTHWVTFTLLGNHMWMHLVLLGVLNAAVAVLLVRVARHWVSEPMSLAIGAIWALLPNHSAIRLWPATAPILLALLLIVLAADLGMRGPSRLPLPTLLVCASALAYEGGIAIGAALLVAHGWRGAPRRAVSASLSGVALTAAWVWHTSPKHATPKGPFAPGRAVAAELGSALLPAGYARAATLLVLAVLVALVLTIAPGFRRPAEARLLLGGLVLIGLGVAPFLVARFPVSTDGLLDRGNSFASIGTAVVLAATGRVLLPALRFLRPSVLVAACAVWVVCNYADLRSAHRADDDARRVLIAFHHLSATESRARLALAPLPNHDGISSFGYGTIGAAAQLELDRQIRISDALTTAEWRAHPGIHVRLQGNRFVRVSL
jgi:hypothetical protein